MVTDTGLTIDRVKAGYTPELTATYLAARLGGRVESSGADWRIAGAGQGGCTVNKETGLWCIHRAQKRFTGGHGTNEGGDCIEAGKYVNSGDLTAALEDLAGFAGILPPLTPSGNGHSRNGAQHNGRANGTPRPAAQPKPEDPPKPRTGPPSHYVCTYDYHDAAGNAAFHVDRTADKQFLAWRTLPDGCDVWKLGNTRRLVYRLPQVRAAIDAGEPVFVCEGEKDADRMAAAGLCGTTAPNGAGAWRTPHAPDLAECLRGAHVVLCFDDDKAGCDGAQDARRVLLPVVASLRVLDLSRYNTAGIQGFDVSDYFEAGGNRDELLTVVDELEAEHKPEPLVYYPSLDREPVRHAPVLTIDGTRIGTVGNISTIIAGAGSGKSAICDAIVAKAVNPSCPGLLIDVELPPGKGVVYVDTERPQEDFDDSYARAMRRAGITRQADVPPSLRYALLALLATPDERQAQVLAEIEAVNAGLLIVDGIGDFVRDPNDAGEVGEAVGWFTAMAKRYGFCCLATLHPNPNDPDKGRGHLGSELWRRGDAYLSLVKDHATEQRTLTSKGRLGKIRRGPDVEGYFTWDDTAKMFMPCEDSRTIGANELPRLGKIISEVFPTGGALSLSYSELVAAVREATGKGERTAKGLVKKASDAGLVEKVDSRYYRNTAAGEGGEPF